MAFILNELEIEDAVRHHIIGSHVLQRFVWTINERSDGWAQWAPAANAATQLQQLVKDQMDGIRDYRAPKPALTSGNIERRLNRALVPMKAFCTRRNIPIDYWLLGIA
jgi:hypothetical protein